MTAIAQPVITHRGPVPVLMTAPGVRPRRVRALVVVMAIVAALGLVPAGPAQAAVTVSFSTVVSGMTASVKVTAYTGVDVRFCWYFGDEVVGGDFGAAILCRGSSASGLAATHTYATPGTYTITVVADDALAEGGSASQTVTVPGTSTVQPPTASFTTSVSGLTVAVDGSASRDVDGTVVRWCYDFGTGAPPACQSTPRASYTYGSPGGYVILLTVTDTSDASASITRTVTVTAPPPAALARDSFSRTLSSGWGTADTGGAWSVSGTATRYTVSGGGGSHRIPAAGTTLSAHLTAVSSARTDTAVTVGVDKAATGGGTYVTVSGRRVGTADYSARLKLNADRTVTLQVARSGTALKAAVLPLAPYTPGSQLRVRVQVLGVLPTTLRARAWTVGAAEPFAWHVTATDSTPALQAAGTVGLTSYLSSTATNAPVTVRFDDLVATSVP